MPTIEESVTINVPAAKVFAFMADGENAAVYDSSVTRSQQEGEGEPADIVAGEPDEVTGLRRLYVCLTRAVTSLVVVHSAPLPAALAA